MPESPPQSSLRRGVGDGGPSSANRAPKPAAPERLQHDLALSGPVEADLTKVVLAMRHAWVGGYGGFWRRIYPISDKATTDADKRVISALRDGFFNFSQLLCGLEILLLQSGKLGSVDEETLLGIEQLFVHLRDYRGKPLGIPDADGGASDFEGGRDGAGGRCDQSEVHKNPPVIGKGCVRASDSMACGDARRGCGPELAATEQEATP